MQGDLGELRRVVAVARSVDLATGGRLWVTALEVWDRGLVLHTAEQLPESLPPGRPIERIELWTISDDRGAHYVPGGGGTTGSQQQRTSTWGFTPGPQIPAHLVLLGPGMDPSQAMEIEIT